MNENDAWKECRLRWQHRVVTNVKYTFTQVMLLVGSCIWTYLRVGFAAALLAPMWHVCVESLQVQLCPTCTDIKHWSLENFPQYTLFSLCLFFSFKIDFGRLRGESCLPSVTGLHLHCKPSAHHNCCWHRLKQYKKNKYNESRIQSDHIQHIWHFDSL